MYKLLLSGLALNDLAEIRAYIADNLKNPSAALSTIQSITEDMRTLQTLPLSGTPLSAIADVQTEHRFLVTGNYLTFYRVQDKTVFIDRVLYGRRDWLRILLEDS